MILSWHQSRVTRNEDFQVWAGSIALIHFYLPGSTGAGGVCEGGAVYKRHLQGCLKLRIWQNLYSMKTCTPLHHSPSRNSSGRTASDILKHLQIFRDGTMDVHKLSHHRLKAPYSIEGWFSKTTMAHVFFPNTSACNIFIIAFSNYRKNRRWC